jgi:hypothetical protein
MKQKYWYVISVILLLALFAAGFLIYQKSLEGLPASPVINNTPPASTSTPPLTQAELDNDQLVFSRASENNDAQLCETIVNTDVKKTCSAQILLNSILSGEKISDCEKISDPMFQRSCVEKLSATQTVADCQEINTSSLRDTCLSITYAAQAKTQNKAEVCTLIPELVRRANCLSEIKKIDLHSDTDKDGFDFLQEILNGTNPDNKDSDGDGYLDGAEAESGFNPDGQGSLNQDLPNNITYCQGIKDAKIKGICLKEFEGNPLDLFDCNKVLIKDLRDYCLKEIIR